MADAVAALRAAARSTGKNRRGDVIFHFLSDLVCIDLVPEGRMLYLPTSIRYSVPFLVLIGILLVRPGGLLGRVEQRKV